MKKECSPDMCRRLSSSDEETCAQKRQSVGESRERAAAIFSSSVNAFSSSKSFAFGGSDAGGAGLAASLATSGTPPPEEGTFSVATPPSVRDSALSSFSRCFLERMCERYAFSVVYTLLITVADHSQKISLGALMGKGVTHLQISQVEPLGDTATAVSCLLSSTF